MIPFLFHSPFTLLESGERGGQVESFLILPALCVRQDRWEGGV